MCFFQISSWTTSMLWISDFNGYSLTFDPDIPRRSRGPQKAPRCPRLFATSETILSAKSAFLAVESPLKYVPPHFAEQWRGFSCANWATTGLASSRVPWQRMQRSVSSKVVVSCFFRHRIQWSLLNGPHTIEKHHQHIVLFHTFAPSCTNSLSTTSCFCAELLAALVTRLLKKAN